ncbi:GNAT family N-acetyltransferase [Lacticaseibacillus porcinae]|uniref:GNAT family N-acetyltransferase n=1 Tax=Lacticaseibacillus porcinae TaxID=1123687 RepID=UPI000F7B8089|nr:GNAT family N-acetyltransferase [Lacticaseibacillus porcinae]
MNYRWITSPDRQLFHELLLLGDEDDRMLQRYTNAGELLAAFNGDQSVGVALFVTVSPETVELKNLAVAPAFQRQGIGKHLMTLGLQHYAGEFQQMLVGTGDRDVENLRFYQHLGFVQSGVRENFFKQYAEPIIVDGQPLKDMILLTQAVPVR